MADPGLQAVIDAELEKGGKEDFQGFTLKYDDARFSAYSEKNDEWNFIVPMKYNGNSVYYIPKSYVERGYAWTNPINNEVQWYSSPLLLNQELQKFLKPAKLDEGLVNAFKVAFSPDRNYQYNSKGEFVKVRDVTSHMLNVPNFDEGFIVDQATFNGFSMKSPSQTVYRWANPLVIPTGMSMYNGEPVYMGVNQWSILLN